MCAFAMKYCTMSHTKEKKGSNERGKLGLKLPSGYQEVMNWCSELTSVVSERGWKGSRQIIKRR